MTSYLPKGLGSSQKMPTSHDRKETTVVRNKTSVVVPVYNTKEEMEGALDNTGHLRDWNFRGSKCDRCGLPNSKVQGLLIQCGLCKNAHYCSQRCFNEDLVNHQAVCLSSVLQQQPKAGPDVLRRGDEEYVETEEQRLFIQKREAELAKKRAEEQEKEMKRKKRFQREPSPEERVKRSWDWDVLFGSSNGSSTNHSTTIHDSSGDEGSVHSFAPDTFDGDYDDFCETEQATKDEAVESFDDVCENELESCNSPACMMLVDNDIETDDKHKLHSVEINQNDIDGTERLQAVGAPIFDCDSFTKQLVTEDLRKEFEFRDPGKPALVEHGYDEDEGDRDEYPLNSDEKGQREAALVPTESLEKHGHDDNEGRPHATELEKASKEQDDEDCKVRGKKITLHDFDEEEIARHRRRVANILEFDAEQRRRLKVGVGDIPEYRWHPEHVNLTEAELIKRIYGWEIPEWVKNRALRHTDASQLDNQQPKKFSQTPVWVVQSPLKSRSPDQRVFPAKKVSVTKEPEWTKRAPLFCRLDENDDRVQALRSPQSTAAYLPTNKGSGKPKQPYIDANRGVLNQIPGESSMIAPEFRASPCQMPGSPRENKRVSIEAKNQLVHGEQKREKRSEKAAEVTAEPDREAVHKVESSVATPPWVKHPPINRREGGLSELLVSPEKLDEKKNFSKPPSWAIQSPLKRKISKPSAVPVARAPDMTDGGRIEETPVLLKDQISATKQLNEKNDQSIEDIVQVECSQVSNQGSNGSRRIEGCLVQNTKSPVRSWRSQSYVSYNHTAQPKNNIVRSPRSCSFSPEKASIEKPVGAAQNGQTRSFSKLPEWAVRSPLRNHRQSTPRSIPESPQPESQVGSNPLAGPVNSSTQVDAAPVDCISSDVSSKDRVDSSVAASPSGPFSDIKDLKGASHRAVTPSKGSHRFRSQSFTQLPSWALQSPLKRQPQPNRLPKTDEVSQPEWVSSQAFPRKSDVKESIAEMTVPRLDHD